MLTVEVNLDLRGQYLYVMPDGEQESKESLALYVPDRLGACIDRSLQETEPTSFAFVQEP
jgi:hypothetical protein